MKHGSCLALSTLQTHTQGINRRNKYRYITEAQTKRNYIKEAQKHSNKKATHTHIHHSSRISFGGTSHQTHIASHVHSHGTQGNV